MSKNKDEHKGGGGWLFFGIVAGIIAGFTVGLLFATSEKNKQPYDENTHDDKGENHDNWQAKARELVLATKDRILFASEEGLRAAQRTRYNTWLDDWDLDSPEF